MNWDDRDAERQREYEERRKRLLAIPEDQSLSLPKQDWYDRIRFIRQQMGMEQLQRFKREIVEPRHAGKENDSWGWKGH